MKRTKKYIDGWQIRNLFDWLFTGTSFLVFLALEGALLYSYFHWLNNVK